jgi:methyl-accepting chemotaxis protein
MSIQYPLPASVVNLAKSTPRPIEQIARALDRCRQVATELEWLAQNVSEIDEIADDLEQLVEQFKDSEV